jgi:tetratricopeptide (TPR) repeat protein
VQEERVRKADALNQRAIAAYKARDFATAATLFALATEIIPDNQTAWLWLSELASSEDDKRACLERVMAGDPTSVAGRLAQAETNRMPPRSQPPDHNGALPAEHARTANTLNQQAIAAFEQGDTTTAARRFLLASTLDPGNQLAWFWLATLAPHPDEKRQCLEHAIILNPDSIEARHASAELRQLQPHIPEIPTASAPPLPLPVPETVAIPAEMQTESITVVASNAEETAALSLVAALYQQAVAAYEVGDRMTAKDLFQQVTRSAPQNQAAWLWLSVLVDDAYERRTCLEHVLAINPQSVEGRRAAVGLSRLRGGQPPTLAAHHQAAEAAWVRHAPDGLVDVLIPLSIGLAFVLFIFFVLLSWM